MNVGEDFRVCTLKDQIYAYTFYITPPMGKSQQATASQMLWENVGSSSIKFFSTLFPYNHTDNLVLICPYSSVPEFHWPLAVFAKL